MPPVLDKMSREELEHFGIEQYTGREKLNSENVILKERIEWFERQVFGKKSERYVPQPVAANQLTLLVEPPQEEVKAVATEEITYTRQKPAERKEKPFRGKIPDDVPRIDHIIEPEGDLSDKVIIGEEITEELEMIPGSFVVHRYIRRKYATPGKEEDGILIGTLPSRPIDKGIPGPGLLAMILIDKFIYHLPYHRLVQRYARMGVHIPASTLGGWQGKSCDLMEIMYQALCRAILRSTYLCVDETPLRVLESKNKGKTHLGFDWVYYSPELKLVFFDYRSGRGREGPELLLKNYQGYLQTDGYAVYEQFGRRPGITLAGCMAHVRRYFEQAKDSDQKRSEFVLSQIQKLYAVEQQARDQQMRTDQRLELRRELSAPIMHTLGLWIKENYQQVTPKSLIGKAVMYFLGRYEAVNQYLRDGRLEIDNNLVENQIRPVAVGRKNYLFAGSHSAAQDAAMIYSLLGCCKLHNVDPYTWLKDILSRLPDYPANRVHELLPHLWKPLTNS